MVRYARPVLLLLTILVTCGFSFYSAYSEVKEGAIRQLNERQMTHARQAVHSIQDFFENYLGLLRHLAANEHIISLDDHGKELMREFYLGHWEQITTVSRTDENGTLIHVVPQNTRTIGTNISRAEHIRQVIETHQPVISDVVTSHLGIQAVVCHLPVFERGEYRGTLGITIPFGYIANRYLNEIRIGEDGHAWLLSQEGIELYCPFPGHVGKSVFENHREFPSILSTAEEMLKGKTGSTTYRDDRVRGGFFRTDVEHAVFMPIPLRNTFWAIAVTTPESEVFANLEGFRNRWLMTIIGLVVFGAIGFYYLLKALMIIREEAKRKDAEVALRESEARYRAVVEDQTELIARFSLDYSLRFANEAYCRHFGDAPGKLPVEGFWHHVLPEDQQGLKSHLDSLSVSNPVGQIELRVMDAAGKVRWLHWVDRLILDEAGNPLEIQAVGRDVSAHKSAEEELQAAHRRLLDIIEFLPDPTFVVDREGRVLAWNRAIEDMTGVDAGAMVGMGDYEYSIPFYGIRRPLLIDLVFLRDAELEAKYSPLRREGGVVVAETFIPSFRGRNVFLWGKASPICDQKGNMVGAIESIRDITETKTAEIALRESEQRFREILENVDLASVILDMDGRVIFCNDFVLKITGWQREEVLGADSFEKFVAEEHRGETERVFRQMVKTGATPSRFENDILTREGEHRTIHWNNSILRDAAGKIAGVTCLGEDITERKRLEKQLSQVQKMEAIGTMAGGIAHDFNNILAAILGYTELSLLQASPSSSLHGHLHQILAATIRARDLVRQILAFSRRPHDLEAVPVSLNAAIRETLKFLRATLPATIEIRMHLSNEDLVVQMNPTQLHQVLVNLAANAAHAMRERGGVLEIALHEVVVNPAEDLRHRRLEAGRYARITVSDTGHGMDAVTMERIFDPYFTTKGVGEGSGLGLSIAHGIVTRFGGVIDVKSEPGEGTRFGILLPKADSVVPSEKDAALVGEVVGGTENILVVDDEESLVDLLTENLSSLGYRVVGKTSAVEALALFLEHPDRFDLVVTDLTMPGATGIDLAEQMLALNAHIRIILSTGFNDSISEERARSLGIQGLLFKPYQRDEVAEMIRSVLDGRARFSTRNADNREEEP